MKGELRPRTTEEHLITQGRPADATLLANLCEIPDVQEALAALSRSPGSPGLAEVFKSGMLLGFYLGTKGKAWRGE